MLRKEVIRRIVERELENLRLIEEVVLRDAPELHQSACDQFGTWDTALQYAGVNERSLYPRREYTQEQILSNIRNHCLKGYRPTAKCVRHYDYRLQEAARKEFGSWRKALHAAGLNLQRAGLWNAKFRRFSKDQVLEALQEWSTAGHSLRWCKICLENRALAIACRGRFGSWRRALVAAGIVSETLPSKNKRKWDQQRIIDHIHRRQHEGKPMYYKAIRKDDSGLLHAAKRYFGGWNQALAAAGVAVKPQNQPEEEYPSNPPD